MIGWWIWLHMCMLMLNVYDNVLKYAVCVIYMTIDYNYDMILTVIMCNSMKLIIFLCLINWFLGFRNQLID